MQKSSRPFLLLILLSAWSVSALAAPRIIQDEPTTLMYPPFWHTPLGIHRGTNDMLKLFVGDRARFSAPQGLACARLLSEASAAPAADDCRVTVLGANSGQGNILYNSSMTSLDVLGGSTSARALFRRPTGVALFPDGTAYVTDPGQRRVLRLRLQSGKLVSDGELPAPPGGWREPWGAAFDSSKLLYLSDAGRDQVLVFSPQGELLRTFGPDLGAGIQLRGPRALAIADAQEPWSYYHDDYLYICDRNGSRLLRINPKTSAPVTPVQVEATTLPVSGTPGQFAWLALDYYENLWVTDPARGQVHKFNRHLRYLTAFGGPGEGDNRFCRPTGIAVYRHFGQVFVAEEQGAHYFWIGTDILQPSLRRLGPAGVLRITFTLTEPSSLTVAVKAGKGAGEELVYKNHRMDAGAQSILWKYPPRRWHEASTLVFTAEATYSSARQMAKRLVLPLPPLRDVPAE